MSAKDIAQVAYNAGWRGEQLVIATAVGLAESGGRYWVVNEIGCVGLWQINVPVHPQWTTAAMKNPAANAAAAMTLYKGAGNHWSPWEAYTGPDGKGSDGPYTTQMGRARLAAASIKGAGDVSAVDAVATSGAGAGTIDPISFQTISDADQANAFTDLLGSIGGLVSGLGGGAVDLGGGVMNFTMGPFVSMGKALIAIATIITRSAKWVSNPRNWLRVVEVIGGAVALFIGLKMLADSGTGGAVSGAVKVSVDTAGKAVKTATKTAAAVATDGASTVAGAAA
jgi:hypothetical protein